MGKTYISFILDETGSMLIIKNMVISGFNEFLSKMRSDDNAAKMRFTLTQFNSDKVAVVYDGAKIDAVAELTDDTYIPNAMTPLYDAIGHTIRALEKKVNGKKKARVLVVIQTDGEENWSKEFTRESIFALIEEKKKDGWTFVFMGADQDAYAASQKLGIGRGNTVSYASHETISAFGGGLSKAASRFMASDEGQTETFWEEDDIS